MKHHNEPSPSTSIKIWILSLPGYGSIPGSVDVVGREMKAHEYPPAWSRGRRSKWGGRQADL